MKVYQCVKCGTSFSLGRGRPPKVAYCPAHKPATSIVSEPVRTVKNNSKHDGGRNITVRNITNAVEAPDPNHPVIHGNRPNGPAITEPCPECGFAYADGGYCEDCGWSLPVIRIPYGTATGERWKNK